MKKSYSLAVAGVGAAICAVLIAASSTTAQQTETQTRQRANNATQTRQNVARRQQRSDRRPAGATVRASEIIGMNITNSRDQDVGEVNDLVLDANQGKIRYAAVTYGGFLGLGDKMFAVPWEAFQVRQSPDDPDEHQLLLNVTKEQMEGAQGFNQDNWPNFADRNFTRELDKRYNVQRRQRDRDVNVNVDRDRNGVDVDVDRNDRGE